LTTSSSAFSFGIQDCTPAFIKRSFNDLLLSFMRIQPHPSFYGQQQLLLNFSVPPKKSLNFFISLATDAALYEY
jgi:hypothetical protein